MAAALGNSSLNTLYSLINGPNADRIGGFIYGAQVDDAARQREGIRLADANLALGNKQAEYSLAAALSRSPETAAMFQPGREVIAPDMQDMAYSLSQTVPEMQATDRKAKEADINYKYALTDRARREPIGGQDKGITAYQQAQLAMEERRLNQTADSQTEQRALRILESGERQALGYEKLADGARMIDPKASMSYVQQAQAARARAAKDAEALYSRTGRSAAAPTDKGLVQPTAAPQAHASPSPSSSTSSSAPSAERDLRLSQLKAALPRATPEQRTKMLGMAAQYGITPEDLAR